VNYRSFTDQYLDSTGTFKEAVIGILAAVVKQERVRISERVAARLERARARGGSVWWSRSSVALIAPEQSINCSKTTTDLVARWDYGRYPPRPKVPGNGNAM
jgi:DNA invertase Pin-like site-specific DNA recombinase